MRRLRWSAWVIGVGVAVSSCGGGDKSSSGDGDAGSGGLGAGDGDGDDSGDGDDLGDGDGDEPGDGDGDEPGDGDGDEPGDGDGDVPGDGDGDDPGDGDGDLGGAGGSMGGAGGLPGDEPCVPTNPATEICDDLDNDCNGRIDDFDPGNDGISDCLNILLIGRAGAHASSNFQSWLTAQGTSVARIHEEASAPPLEALDLADVDVLFLDFLQRDYATEEAEVLAQWVESGGGLMSMNGHTGSTDRTRGNSLLVGLDVSYEAGLQNGPITSFVEHPLTVGLTSVTFQGGYRIVTLEPAAGHTVVAEHAGGVVGLAVSAGLGRGFVWGDEWVQFDSQWQNSPEIHQFWVNALGWLTQ